MEKVMRFAERELKPYSEPATPDQLKVGETYFGVQFLDEDGFVPVLEPKVFIGHNLKPEDEDELYFQDYASYQTGIRYDTASAEDESVFETGAEKHVFEYERALDVLLRCSLRREKGRR
ncbi:MAG TPA: hypothetical protein VK850_18310 [Candidatus Binatia bacterium]|nr:hypothetical protein [Candidatus Binatia bacterium]